MEHNLTANFEARSMKYGISRNEVQLPRLCSMHNRDRNGRKYTRKRLKTKNEEESNDGKRELFDDNGTPVHTLCFPTYIST